MAKMRRFRLRMEKGIEVLDINSLKANFTIDLIRGYYHDGRLMDWLTAGAYSKEIDILREIKEDDPELDLKLCQLFDVPYVDVKNKEGMSEEEKIEFIISYINDSTRLLELLSDMSSTWKPKDGELITRKERKDFSDFMKKVIANLDKNSRIGNSIINSLNNMTLFIQTVFLRYEEIRIDEVMGAKVDQNAAIEGYGYYEDGIVNKTLIEYYLDFINNMFSGDIGFGPKRQSYDLTELDSWISVFPDYSSYADFGYLHYMDYYLDLFNAVFNKIKARMDDKEFKDYIFGYCKRFPMEYSDNYNSIFIRQVDHDYSIPYIEIDDLYSNSNSKSVGYLSKAGIDMERFGAALISFRFVNISTRGLIINHEYYDSSTSSTCEFADIYWFEIDDNEVGVKIIPKTKKRGNLKMKIFVEDDPDIAAYVKVGGDNFLEDEEIMENFNDANLVKDAKKTLYGFKNEDLITKYKYPTTEKFLEELEANSEEMSIKEFLAKSGEFGRKKSDRRKLLELISKTLEGYWTIAEFFDKVKERKIEATIDDLLEDEEIMENFNDANLVKDAKKTLYGFKNEDLITKYKYPTTEKFLEELEANSEEMSIKEFLAKSEEFGRKKSDRRKLLELISITLEGYWTIAEFFDKVKERKIEATIDDLLEDEEIMENFNDANLVKEAQKTIYGFKKM